MYIYILGGKKNLSGKGNPDSNYLEMGKTVKDYTEHEHTMHYSLLVFSECVTALICRPALLV